MSVIENIQKLFKSKRVQPAEDSMDMVSLSIPAEPFATEDLNQRFAETATHSYDDGFAPTSIVLPEGGKQASGELLTLPLLGSRTLSQHQRILVLLLSLAVAVLGLVTFMALNHADRVAQQVAATGQSLMQSQRLAKSVSQALVGSAQAFPDVRESADVLAKTVRGLKSGDDSLHLSPVNDDLQDEVEKVNPLMERAEKNANIVMGQQAILTQVGNALRTINRQ